MKLKGEFLILSKKFDSYHPAKKDQNQ